MADRVLRDHADDCDKNAVLYVAQAEYELDNDADLPAIGWALLAIEKRLEWLGVVLTTGEQYES